MSSTSSVMTRQLLTAPLRRAAWAQLDTAQHPTLAPAPVAPEQAIRLRIAQAQTQRAAAADELDELDRTYRGMLARLGAWDAAVRALSEAIQYHRNRYWALLQQENADRRELVRLACAAVPAAMALV